MRFGLAWNQRSQQGEDKPHYFEITCWRDLAENVAESVTRGMRVVVYGRLDYQSWESQNGEKRSTIKVLADEVSPSIRWATAQVSKKRTWGRGFAQPRSQINRMQALILEQAMKSLMRSRSNGR